MRTTCIRMPPNNPAVAIQFGLMEALQYLVEEKRVHVNDIVWTPFRHERSTHLLYFSMKFAQEFNNDSDIFRYLLLNSEEGGPCGNIRIKTNATANSRPLFTALFKFPSLCKETGRQMFPFLDIFMQHPDFDINGLIVPMGNFFITPLQAMSFDIMISLRKRKFDLSWFRRLLRGAEILLEAGADPHLVPLPGFRATIQRMTANKRIAEEEFLAQPQNESLSFHDERGKYWDEAIALFRRY